MTEEYLLRIRRQCPEPTWTDCPYWFFIDEPEQLPLSFCYDFEPIAVSAFKKLQLEKKRFFIKDAVIYSAWVFDEKQLFPSPYVGEDDPAADAWLAVDRLRILNKLEALRDK